MKHLMIAIVTSAAIGCGSAAESPTAPTTSSLGSLELGPPQTYDSHPVPPVDPEPGADPAPPSPVPGPVPAEPTPDPAPGTPTDPTPTPTFNGTYTGSLGSGNDTCCMGIDIHPVTLTVANDVASFVVGSEGPIAGTVSGTGALAARGGSCNVTITGQITVTTSGVATASGTWSHPAIICGASANGGTWAATR